MSILNPCPLDSTITMSTSSKKGSSALPRPFFQPFPVLYEDPYLVSEDRLVRDFFETRLQTPFLSPFQYQTNSSQAERRRTPTVLSETVVRQSSPSAVAARRCLIPQKISADREALFDREALVATLASALGESSSLCLHRTELETVLDTEIISRHTDRIPTPMQFRQVSNQTTPCADHSATLSKRLLSRLDTSSGPSERKTSTLSGWLVAQLAFPDNRPAELPEISLSVDPPNQISRVDLPPPQRRSMTDIAEENVDYASRILMKFEEREGLPKNTQIQLLTSLRHVIVDVAPTCENKTGLPSIPSNPTSVINEIINNNDPAPGRRIPLPQLDDGGNASFSELVLRDLKSGDLIDTMDISNHETTEWSAFLAEDCIQRRTSAHLHPYLNWTLPYKAIPRVDKTIALLNSPRSTTTSIVLTPLVSQMTSILCRPSRGLRETKEQVLTVVSNEKSYSRSVEIAEHWRGETESQFIQQLFGETLESKDSNPGVGKNAQSLDRDRTAAIVSDSCVPRQVAATPMTIKIKATSEIDSLLQELDRRHRQLLSTASLLSRQSWGLDVLDVAALSVASISTMKTNDRNCFALVTIVRQTCNCLLHLGIKIAWFYIQEAMRQLPELKPDLEDMLDIFPPVRLGVSLENRVDHPSHETLKTVLKARAEEKKASRICVLVDACACSSIRQFIASSLNMGVYSLDESRRATVGPHSSCCCVVVETHASLLEKIDPCNSSMGLREFDLIIEASPPQGRVNLDLLFQKEAMKADEVFPACEVVKIKTELLHSLTNGQHSSLPGHVQTAPKTQASIKGHHTPSRHSSPTENRSCALSAQRSGVVVPVVISRASFVSKSTLSSALNDLQRTTNVRVIARRDSSVADAMLPPTTALLIVHLQEFDSAIAKCQSAVTKLCGSFNEIVVVSEGSKRKTQMLAACIQPLKSRMQRAGIELTLIASTTINSLLPDLVQRLSDDIRFKVFTSLNEKESPVEEILNDVRNGSPFLSFLVAKALEEGTNETRRLNDPETKAAILRRLKTNRDRIHRILSREWKESAGHINKFIEDCVQELQSREERCLPAIESFTGSDGYVSDDTPVLDDRSFYSISESGSRVEISCGSRTDYDSIQSETKFEEMEQTSRSNAFQTSRRISERKDLGRSTRFETPRPSPRCRDVNRGIQRRRHESLGWSSQSSGSETELLNSAFSAGLDSMTEISGLANDEQPSANRTQESAVHGNERHKPASLWDIFGEEKSEPVSKSIEEKPCLRLPSRKRRLTPQLFPDYRRLKRTRKAPFKQRPLWL